MGQSGVEEAPGEALRRRRRRDGFSAGHPVDQCSPGRREPQEPDRRSSDEDPAVTGPPDTGIEGNPETLRERLARRDGAQVIVVRRCCL
jgi:hypothetical protein